MFFVAREAEQQGLDINVGRVLDMYATGVLPREKTVDALIRYFGETARMEADAVKAQLSYVLNQVDNSSIDLNHARKGLVEAAAAAEHHNPHYADMLNELAG